MRPRTRPAATPAAGHEQRSRRGAAALLAALLVAPLFVATATDVPAGAAAPSPAPVAGVEAFGLGARQLSSPGALAVDARGDVFAVDAPNHRVLEFPFDSARGGPSRGGTIAAGAGGQGRGADQLTAPSDVAVNAAGDLFVADGGNSRIQRYPYDAASGTYAAGGVTVVTGTSGAIAFDATGNLLVSDPVANRTTKYAYDAASATFAPAGTAVLPLGGGAIALNATGDLFYVDRSSLKVVRYRYDAGAGTFATTGTPVTQQHALPNDLAFDVQGNLFVSWHNLGLGGLAEYTYDAASASFSAAPVATGVAATGPTGVAFDRAGRLYVGHTQYTFNPNATYWNLVLGYTYDAARRLYVPGGTIMGQQGRVNTGTSGLALDGDRNLFVANSIDNKVYRFAFDPGTQTYGPQAAVVASGLSGPAGLATNRAGDVFIAETGSSRVLVYRRNATTGTYAPGGAIPGATALATASVRDLAIDSKDNLFAVIANQVREFVFDPATGTYAGTGIVVATPSSPTIPAFGAMGIGLDPRDNLFMTDPATHRVLELLVNPATGAYAPTGIVVAGAGGLGNGLNQLNLPIDVAVDTSGNLFVFDSGNFRIIQFTGDPTTGTYSATGTVVTVEGVANMPAQGAVAADRAGDAFYNNNMVNATVYEVTASGSTPPPPTTTTTTAPTTTTTTAPTTTTTTAPTTTTTTAPTTTTTTAPTTTTTTTAPPPPPGNLVANPGFEAAGVPADVWGSRLARSTAVVHGGTTALAQTATATSGGWDLDADTAWFAPVAAGKTYTASVWVRSTAAAKAVLNVDLLTASGKYLTSAAGAKVTLVPGTWTKLTVTVKPSGTQAVAAMEPNFSGATSGTILYWDDMSVTPA